MIESLWPVADEAEPTPIYNGVLTKEESPVGDNDEVHPISGYRQLTEQEVDLVNTNKGMENDLGRWLKQLRQDYPDADPRWLAVARTHFQEGFMALNRAVTRPESEL